MKKFLSRCSSLFFFVLLAGSGLGQETNSVSVVKLIQRGRAELASNHLDAAESYFRLASETEPTNSIAYAWLGNSLARLNRRPEAATAYEKAVELNPQRTNTWLHLGDTYYSLGNHEKAVDAYEQCAFLNSENANAYYGLYSSLARLKRYDEAESACRLAIAINPTNSTYHAGLAYCLEELGRHKDAITELEQALSLNPGTGVYLWLGICHYRDKAYQEAVAALQKCVSVEPTNFDGHAWLGYSLYRLDRYDAAVSAFQKAVQIKPDDFKVNFWLGRSFAELNRYREAANAFQEAVRINPNDFEANDWRGMSLLKIGQFEKAAANFEKAYDIKREDKATGWELFFCYLLSSQYEKAYRLYPGIFVFGGGSLMLGYLAALTVLLRFSFKISPNPSPGLGFSFAWLALFFEGQIAFIFCLGLLSLIKLSENFLFGITLAGIPVIFAATRAFERQPWGQPFAWPLRFGTAKIMWLSLLGLISALLFGSWCAEGVARVMHRPVTVQETIPLIKYALSANPATAFLSIVIIGPIAEEIIFRGLIHGALEKWLGVAGAILVSSFIFASVHLQVIHFISIFCLGIVLSWARWKSGSLGLPILLHVLNNGVALLLLKFFERSV